MADIIDLDAQFLGDNPTDAKKRKFRLKNLASELLTSYTNILVCNVDNVGSKQMQQIRAMLRNRAVVMLGKNTLIRKVIRDHAESHPQLQNLVPSLVGNVGLVMVKDGENIAEIRKLVCENQVPAAAKVGVIAPQDVFVGPGPTGLDPGQTSFFQALNIATKIVRGSIEIQTLVHLVQKGAKVSAGAVALLSKLNKKPFFYGVQALSVYENGAVYDVAALDISAEDLIKKFGKAASYLAAVAMAAKLPVEAALPHYVANAFQRLVALALVTEITFDEAEPYKEYLANPDAFKVAAPAAVEAAPAAAAAVVEEDSDDDAEEFSLFD